MPPFLATFKYAPTKTIPNRIGPVQCIRNCTNCVLRRATGDDVDAENIIAIKSFDDLVQRQSLWLTKYQTIQYHIGQADVLRRSLLRIEPALVIYVVASSRLEDLNYLERVLDYEGLPKVKLQCKPLDSIKLEFRVKKRHLMVPIKQRSCVVTNRKATDCELLEVRGLRDFLSPIINQIVKNDVSEKVALVPVAISKDHDKSTLFGFGSICIQIMEPYYLQEYLSNVRSQYKTGHIVQHLYHDVSMYNPRLPCHLAAFLILYLDRECGVSRDDLIEHFNWLCKSSMEFDLHLAYTGNTEEALDFALLVLNDYIRCDPIEQIYRVDNIEALTQYANPMIPNMAYYGILSRAALMLYNRDEKNSIQIRYHADVRVKVMKDDVLDVGQDLAERIDNMIPCRRPCVDICTALITTFNSMQTFGKYFRVKEARVRPSGGYGRFGDYDSDEEYYLSKRDDPAFKPWIILTQRPYRLDRLNLFMNCIEGYLESIDPGEEL